MREFAGWISQKGQWDSVCVCLEREQWWKSTGFSKMGIAVALWSCALVRGDNSAVFSCVYGLVMSQLHVKEGVNCSSLLPVSSVSLRKKDLRGERKLQKDFYLEDERPSRGSKDIRKNILGDRTKVESLPCSTGQPCWVVGSVWSAGDPLCPHGSRTNKPYHPGKRQNHLE